MRILILVIYSRNEAYDKMLEIQRRYIHKYENVDVYFIVSNFEHNEPVFIEGNMSCVRSKEDNQYILYKNLETMDTLHNLYKKEYDFIIRTNVSTIIDIPKLKNLLTSYQNIEYLYAGHIASISEQNIRFALGTCIIISKKLGIKMIQEKHLFDHSLPDDVAFGVYVRDHCPEAFNNDLKLGPFVYYISDLPSGWNATLEEFIHFVKNNNTSKYIYYRNKTHNRMEDVKIMDYICTHLIK